jgi:hypothetical protein
MPFGGFDETPEITSALLGEFAAAGLVNLVGGCCGTTPDHIRAIKAAVADAAPRSLPALEDFTSFSGLEPFRITPETGFVMVGERTNITGSKRFASLIESGDFQAAVGRRARPGGERRQPDRREHGHRPDRRRAGDDPVPQPRRDRAGDREGPHHGRLLQVGRDRGRP